MICRSSSASIFMTQPASCRMYAILSGSQSDASITAAAPARHTPISVMIGLIPRGTAIITVFSFPTPFCFK